MRQDRKKIRHRQLLHTALAVFAEKGYDKTSMEDIRAASNVSKGTLYLYFESKEALFVAVATLMFDELYAYLEQRLAESNSTSAADRLQLLLSGLNQTIERDDQRIGLYADFFVQAWQRESMRKILLQAYERYIALLTQMIQQALDSGRLRDVDAEATARVIIGTLDGIFLQKLFDPTADIERAWTQLEKMVMTTLGIDVRS